MVLEDGEFTGSRSGTIFQPVMENGPFYSLGRLLTLFIYIYIYI